MTPRLALLAALLVLPGPAAAAREGRPDAGETAQRLFRQYGFDPAHIAELIGRGRRLHPFATFLGRLAALHREPFDPALHAPGAPCRRLPDRPEAAAPGTVQWHCNAGGAADWADTVWRVDAQGRVTAVVLSVEWLLVADVERPAQSSLNDRQWAQYATMSHDALAAGFTLAAPPNVAYVSQGERMVMPVELP